MFQSVDIWIEEKALKQQVTCNKERTTSANLGIKNQDQMFISSRHSRSVIKKSEGNWNFTFGYNQ